MKCDVRSEKCEVCEVNCEVRSKKCEDEVRSVRSVKWYVKCEV